MQKSYDEFLRDLGISESSGRYNIQNEYGYLGKYQMGEQALVAAGYYKPKLNYNNKWDGEFTGKDGVYSVNNRTSYPTGYASNISNTTHIFTPEEIGKMTPEEFTQNEGVIMNQLKQGQIQPGRIQNYAGYVNPVTGDNINF